MGDISIPVRWILCERSPWIKTSEVQHYHSLVSGLEEASGEDLSHFKIPPDRLKPKIISVRRGTRHGPGSAQYSSEPYCDSDFFQSQLDGLKQYLKSLSERPLPSETPNQYQDLADWQLEDLMINRKIKPKRELVNGREVWKADRNYIIAALLKQDNPPAPVNSTVIHNYVTDSNFIQNSPGASIIESVDLKSPAFATFLENLKTISSSGQLSAADRDQFNMHIGTIQLHINSSAPSTPSFAIRLNPFGPFWRTLRGPCSPQV